MFFNSNWSHSRTTSSVRNAESFVKVQVADISPEIPRGSQTNLGIHVGSVQINLTAESVYCVNRGPHGVLVDSVSRRISDHETAESVFVLLTLGFEVIQINVAIRIRC